jgi:hypothetical protein
MRINYPTRKQPETPRRASARKFAALTGKLRMCQTKLAYLVHDTNPEARPNNRTK